MEMEKIMAGQVQLTTPPSLPSSSSIPTSICSNSTEPTRVKRRRSKRSKKRNAEQRDGSQTPVPTADKGETVHKTSEQPSAPAENSDPTGSAPAKAQNSLVLEDDPSVFDLLNAFRCRLYVSCDALIVHVHAATKDVDGNIDWLNLKSSYHPEIVKKSLGVAHAQFSGFGLSKLKKAMFCFLLGERAAF